MSTALAPAELRTLLVFPPQGHTTQPYLALPSLKAWLARDPIPAYRKRMAEFGIDKAMIDGIEANVLKRVDEAVETAKASPPPPVSLLETEVYADGGAAWRN